MVFEKIIVLDDELIIRKSLEEHLRRKRYSVVSAATIAEAENHLAQGPLRPRFRRRPTCPTATASICCARLAQQPDSPIGRHHDRPGLHRIRRGMHARRGV